MRTLKVMSFFLRFLEIRKIRKRGPTGKFVCSLRSEVKLRQSINLKDNFRTNCVSVPRISKALARLKGSWLRSTPRLSSVLARRMGLAVAASAILGVRSFASTKTTTRFYMDSRLENRTMTA